MPVALSPEIERFLNRPLMGVLAWTSESGEPRSTPISYVWHDQAIWLTTGASSAKVRALRKRPVASFSIASEPSFPPPQAVTVRGHAEIRAYDAERHLRGFTRYGIPQAEAEKMRDEYAQMELVSIRVEPSHVLTFGF